MKNYLFLKITETSGFVSGKLFWDGFINYFSFATISESSKNSAMLTRRYLRIKVLQQLYEVSRKQETTLNTEEERLIQRVHDIYNLYIHQLSFLLKIKDYAEQRIEEGKQKYFPTQEELNPNMKFVRNMFLVQLESNISLQKYIETYRINWAEQQDMIRNFYKKID